VFLGFDVQHSGVVEADGGGLVDGGHLASPELDLVLVAVAQQAQVDGHVGVLVSVAHLVGELVVEQRVILVHEFAVGPPLRVVALAEECDLLLGVHWVLELDDVALLAFVLESVAAEDPEHD